MANRNSTLPPDNKKTQEEFERIVAAERRRDTERAAFEAQVRKDIDSLPTTEEHPQNRPSSEDENRDIDPGQRNYEKTFQNPAERRAAASRDLSDQENATARQRASQPKDAAKGERKAHDKPVKGTPKGGPATATPWGRIMRGLSGRGGLSGFIVAVFLIMMVSIVPSLFSFKIPSIMDLIGGVRGAVAEYVTDRVGRRILLEAMTQFFGDDRRSGKVGELTQAMRDNPEFREHMRKNGVEFERSGSGIRLIINGVDLGECNSGSGCLELIEGQDDQSRQRAFTALSLATNMGKWGVRVNVVNWAKNWLGLARIGVDPSDDEDREEKRRKTHEGFFRPIFGKITEVFVSTTGCFMSPSSSGCNLGRNLTDTGAEVPDGAEAGDDSDDRRQEFESEINQSLDESNSDAAEQASKGQRVTSSFMSNIISKFVGAFGTRAIPYVGQIDALASIIYWIDQGSQNQFFRKIPPEAKTLISSTMYMMWAGLGDQIKAGELDADTVGMFAQYFDEPEECNEWDAAQRQAEGCGNSEQAIATQYLQGNLDPSMLGGDAPGVIGLTEMEKVNARNPDAITGGLQSVIDGIAMAIRFTPLYGAAYAWYFTIGWVLRTAGDLLGQGLAAAFCATLPFHPTVWIGNAVIPEEYQLPTSCEEMTDQMVEALSLILPLLLPMLGLLDPLAKGAKLMNYLDMGATATNNRALQAMGARALNDGQYATLHRKGIELQEEQFRNLPLRDRIFSPDSPRSVVSQMAMSMPSATTSSPAVNTLATIGHFPSMALASLIPGVSATPVPERIEYEDLYGIYPFGATEEDLEEEIDPMLFEDDAPAPSFPEDPDDYAGEPGQINPTGADYNAYAVQYNVTESLIANVKNDDGSGFGTGDTIDGNAQELAQRILDIADAGDGITIQDNPRGTLEEIASGQQATAHGGSGSTDLSVKLLQVMLAIHEEGMPFTITSLTTGGHSTNSLHYSGRAVDMGVQSADRIAAFVFENRERFDIQELFYDPTPQYSISGGTPTGRAIGGHSDHIHIGVSE